MSAQRVVRQADCANEPGIDELRHRAPGLLERDARLVREVQEVHIEVLPPEPMQACAACGMNLIVTESRSAAGDRSTGCGLGGDQELAPDSGARAAPISDSLRVSR